MRLVLTGLLAVVLVACAPSGSGGGAGSPSPAPTVPVQLQQGTDWELMWGAAVSKPYDVTLRFEPGKVSGAAPVNRYFGPAQVDQDGSLKFGALARTEMGGPRDRMADEAAYMDALAGVDAWQAGDEQLDLMVGDEVVLRYALPGSAGAFGKTLFGMTVKQADKAAAEAGYITRVISVDGTPKAATMDYRPDRLNLTVVDGRVTQVTVG